MTSLPCRALVRALLVLPLLLCAPANAAPRSPAPQAALVSLADQFVPLVLEIGTYEPDFVDAYLGPPALRAKAQAKPRSRATLEKAAQAAVTRLDQQIIPKLSDPLQIGRARALRGFYKAAATRLAMIGGKSFPFDVEAEGLFALKPELKPLSHYDDILTRLDALVPGTGSLAERFDSYNDRFIIPKDKLRPVMEAAIAECRRRTLAHFDLPKEESFTLEFVTGKSWSGYNYYQGNYHSLIQVNTDLPVRISRAIDLGCHEGYPGHHVLNIMIERRLVRDLGWKEYLVNPLYAPQSLISEGSANYGIELAFPGEEQFAFERDILFPIAGLDPAQARAAWDVRRASTELSGARMTIAKLYLDGEIDREKALQLLERYQLTTRKRAEQSLAFIDQYRSYVINYYLGQEIVRGYVDRGDPDVATRWERMRHVLSDTMLPADLIGR